MVRPTGFNSNPETIGSNSFQFSTVGTDDSISISALAEFDEMREKLIRNDFELIILEEPINSELPDSIFPNNWFSTHHDKLMVIYPMLSQLRRLEKRPEFIKVIKEIGRCNTVLDLSAYENKSKFLEGTGSVVFDHKNKKAFCCASPRSDRDIFEKLCESLSYKPVYFHAKNKNGIDIYHTNVLMAIGISTVVICMEIIKEKDLLSNELNACTLIEISEDQMNHFAGNVLLAQNKSEQYFWLMSKSAEESLDIFQKELLLKEGEILSFEIPTIETYGGGSVRCMIAEMY